MMEKLQAPQTHLGLKAMIKEVDEDDDGAISFREFLIIFRKAAAGELDLESGLGQLATLTEVDVDEVGVGGAKTFFEAKVGILELEPNQSSKQNSLAFPPSTNCFMFKLFIATLFDLSHSRLLKCPRAVSSKKRYEKSRRKERGKKRRKETDNRLSERGLLSLVVAPKYWVCVLVLSLNDWEKSYQTWP